MRTEVFALLCAGCVASGADATVYVVDTTLKNVAVHGTITTDGTIGKIDAANILSYTFSFQKVSFTGTSADIDQRGMSLIATATDLSADFTKTTTYQWFYFNSPDQLDFFCVQGSNCYDAKGPGLGVGYNQTPTIYSTKMSGVQAFAHVETVPEPASWAMFIGGFGLIGSTLRRRPAKVRFA